MPESLMLTAAPMYVFWEGPEFERNSKVVLHTVREQILFSSLCNAFTLPVWITYATDILNVNGNASGTCLVLRYLVENQRY